MSDVYSPAEIDAFHTAGFSVAAYARLVEALTYRFAGGGGGVVPDTRIVAAGVGLTGGGDLSADISLAADFGTAAGKVCQGNDSRLSNTRVPTAHASTHASGGSDPVTTAAIGAEPVSSKYFLSTAFSTNSTTLVDVNTFNAAIANLVTGKTYLLEFEGAVSSGGAAAVGLAFIFGSTSSAIQGQGWLGGASSVFNATENTTGSFSLTKNGSSTPVHLSCVITTTSTGTLKLQASIASGTLTIRQNSWLRVTALT